LLRIDQHGDEFRRLAQTSLLGYACNKVYSKAILKDKLFPELNFREDLLLNLDVLGDTAEIATAYKNCGYRIACAAIPDSLPCFEADLSLPLLLVIGGEKRGISSKLLQIKDLNVRIPYGTEFMGSLSTSSAVSILAYEILRQNSIKQ
jgi:tRNA(Leu) C34 or U34 (ribose-2'-O)-methylase TrmL